MTDQGRPRLDIGHDEGDPTNQPFLMPVEDVIMIPGRGLSANGRIESGSIRVGDTVEVVGSRGIAGFTVVGIATMHHELERAQVGDVVGMFLRGAGRGDVGSGDVLASRGTIGAHAAFSADIHFLSKEEGGRHTPIFAGYRFEFRFPGRGFAGSTSFPDGVEIVFPGSDVRVEVELADRTAMKVGQRFTVHNAGRIEGTGVVVALSGQGE